jgi:multiple sugar transport system substrate-binding protein
MKRYVYLVLCLLIAMSMVLTACQPQTAATEEPPDVQSTAEEPATEEPEAGLPVVEEPITLNLLSHRYAALEFYAQELIDDAPENVTVVPELTTYTEWQQKMRLNLSSGSDAYDISYMYTTDLAEFASHGWLVPLDDYIEKYWDVYDFGDIPQYLWDAYTYDGKIYGIPSHQWAMITFARTDLIDEAGFEVPKTLDELLEVAAGTTTDEHAGLAMQLKASDHLANTFQCFLTAYNTWWFDDDMVPAFNSDEALAAIEYMQKLIPYLPEGSSTYGTDEVTVAMGQGQAVIGLLQTTRSSTMSDPEKSSVVGLVDFYAPPSIVEGGPALSQFATAGYSISAFTQYDPEISFITLANALDTESMMDGAAVGMPVRASVLTEELLAERPDYAAAWDALQSGVGQRPAIPEFNEIMEISMTALAKVLWEGGDAKTLMDEAAAQAYDILAAAGYYK